MGAGLVHRRFLALKVPDIAFLAFLSILCAYCRASIAATVEVDSEYGLYKAFITSNVSRVVVLRSIKLQQEFWANTWAAINVSRDVLVEGGNDNWTEFPELDFSFISAKLVMAPNVTVTFRRLALLNLFSRIQPSYDFFAISPHSTTIVWEDVVDHLILCMPLDFASAAWSAALRPVDAPGGAAVHQNVTLSQTPFCHSGMGRCFQPVMQGWDMVTYGTSGYRIAWSNAITICDGFATQDCIDRLGPDMCYATTLRDLLAQRSQLHQALNTAPSSSLTPAGRAGIIAGCVLGGVAAALSVASIVWMRRRRRSGTRTAGARTYGHPAPTKQTSLAADLECDANGAGAELDEGQSHACGSASTPIRHQLPCAITARERNDAVVYDYTARSGGNLFMPNASTGAAATKDVRTGHARAVIGATDTFPDHAAVSGACASPAAALNTAAQGPSSSGSQTSNLGSALLLLFRSLAGAPSGPGGRTGCGGGSGAATDTHARLLNTAPQQLLPSADMANATAVTPSISESALAGGAAGHASVFLHHTPQHDGSFNLPTPPAAALLEQAAAPGGDARGDGGGIRDAHSGGAAAASAAAAAAAAAATAGSGSRGVGTRGAEDLLLARFLPGVASGLADVGCPSSQAGQVTPEARNAGDADAVETSAEDGASRTGQEVMLGQLIGSGSFGKVYKGTWRGACVAVKVIAHDRLNTMDRIDNELRLSLSFEHRNVVRALSYITCSVDEDGKPTLTIQSRAAGRVLGGSGVDRAGVDTWDWHGSDLTCSAGSGGGMIGALYERAAVASRDGSAAGEPLRRDVAETWVIQEYMAKGTLARLIKNGGLLVRSTSLPSPMPSGAWTPPAATWATATAATAGADDPVGTAAAAAPAPPMAPMAPNPPSNCSLPPECLLSPASPRTKPHLAPPPPPPDMHRVVHCALDVARGLQYLHSRNVVHGDLKPGNILLAEDPDSPWGFVAKLADFGLSRALSSDRTHLTTNTLGTVSYMCPEVLSSGKVSPASCVYSYGIILWELVSGRPPHCGRMAGHVIKQVVLEDQRPDFDGVAGVPEWYAELARRCWAKDPSARPCMEQVVTELQCRAGAMSQGGGKAVRPIG